ncbi:MAG: hypothetical protein IJ725_02080 [Ruminococcus sp.]|nr:hypothetical protein [Ruminococcus sp.]
MKRLLTVSIISLLIIVMISGCSLFPAPQQPTQAAETSSKVEETTTGAQTSEEETQQGVKTTDEFPTEGDENEDTYTYTEPQGRWSVQVPNEWDEYGEIINLNGNVRFVYKKAYEEYGAGHVFTICTKDALNKVDVTTYPRAEEIYLDSNIQVFVEYPTDVQFGGMDGSEMDEQAPEYSALSELEEEIIDSLEILI